jgi:protein gp37
MPRRLDRKHAEFFAMHGRRRRLFCASLADVFDNEVPEQWRLDLFNLIADTPNIDWLILTKRIGNAAEMLDWATNGGWHRAGGWRNVWLGATVVNQKEADRDIQKLLDVLAAVRFLSMEPLLGPVSFNQDLPKLDWVIAGGESGPRARPMHPGWIRSIRDQCSAVGVPFHFKQWGAWVPHEAIAGGDLGGLARYGKARIVHPNGETDEEVYEVTGGRSAIRGSQWMENIGRRPCGRQIDGVEHNGFPEVRLAA